MNDSNILRLAMSACLLYSGLDASSQYDPQAETYSENVQVQNEESLAVFARFLEMPLEGKRVLDLGCGDGEALSKLAARGAKIYGIDGSSEMVKLARATNPHAEIIEGDFTQLPYPNNSFDLVISKWALQTTESIAPVYEGVRRVLKPGGQLVCLACHPMRQFIEKKRHGIDYFQQETVTSVFFDGLVTAQEPSHTMNEYLSPFFFEHFSLEAFEEGFDSGAEKVNGDIYPSFFIIKATLKDA